MSTSFKKSEFYDGKEKFQLKKVEFQEHQTLKFLYHFFMW